MLRFFFPIFLLTILVGCAPTAAEELGGSAAPVPMHPGEEPVQGRAAAAKAVADSVAERTSHLRPLDEVAHRWVEETLSGLTLRQRVAQLVLPWISGQSGSENPAELERMVRWVAEDEVGGLIVSTGAPTTLAAKLARAQAHARVPLLIVADLETGPAMRLRPGGTDFPPAMAFGAADEITLAREAGRITGIEARAVGIHMTLGPILDVNSNPNNPIINVRSFGEDPQRVARLATAWIQGARESGLLATGKHFPGHGDTESDSHVARVSVRADSARLEAVNLPPFRKAIEAGIDGILVGHISTTGLEGELAPPASLSPRMIGGLLRGELGFEGMVMTDALNMGAVTRNYSVEEASILALLAGADLLLQPPGTRSVIDAIVGAVHMGRIPEARIEGAVRRVLEGKARAGLHLGSVTPLDAVARQVGTDEHRAVARRVITASITLVRDERDLVPVPVSRRRILHLVYSEGAGAAAEALTQALSAGGLNIESVRVGPRTSAGEFAALCRRASAADLVIATASLAPHQYRSLGLEGGFGDFVEELARSGRPVIAVSLGSPYLLQAFPSVPSYLIGWSGTRAAQRGVARALLGEAPIVGRLPVSLHPHHETGDGITRLPEPRPR